MQTTNLVIPDNYVLSGRVFVRAGVKADFGYNDGDRVEEYMLDTMKSAEDPGTGSEELQRAIRDWPTRYHFSPQRADLLRPFADFFAGGGSVLEVGSGCGAITRYLGECGAMVTALEGSPRRANITAERCRDLENVIVVNEALSEFDPGTRYDCVTLIGVLEYSQLFGGTPSGMLRQCLSLLKEEGILLIAIENKLGLKYWAGMPEDHLGVAFAGIEDRYSDESPLTFGKEELGTLLDSAGFSWNQFYYPYPDYKLPSVVLTEQALTDPDLNLVNLVRPVLEGCGSDPGAAFQSAVSFDPARTVASLASNHLLGALSNSFMVMAGASEVCRYAERALAYSFNSARKRAFNKTNIFLRQENGSIWVKRVPHFPGMPVPGGLVAEQKLEGERYAAGTLYSMRLYDLLSSEGWRLEDIVAWGRPYYMLLKSFAIEQQGSLYLPGRFADLAPFNVLEGKDGLIMIDLEWEVMGELPVEYIFFRGLYHCLVRAGIAALPASGTPTNAFGLIVAVLERLGAKSDGVIQDFIERETVCFGGISPAEDRVPRDVALRLAGVDVTARAGAGRNMPLYPLRDLHAQVFVETDSSGFCEDVSLKFRIELHPVRRVHVLQLPVFEGRIVRLRIDPSDRPGLVQVHAVTLRNEQGATIFHWTPFSRSHTELSGVMIIHQAPMLPDPVFILTDYDPMMIFSLDDARPAYETSRLTVEIELSTVSDHHFVNITKMWQQLYA